MNSYNHYAYGAIGDWMYRVIAGIDTKTDAPGYKQMVIKPTIGGKLDSVSADYETNYGKVSSHWKMDNGNVLLDVEIPPNTTATVYVPAKDGSSLLESGNPMPATAAPGYLVVNIGSGIYHFSTAATQPQTK
jgi:alpha-L-rhamnosidase